MRRKSTRRQSQAVSLLIMVAVCVICVLCVIKITNLRAMSKELQIEKAVLEQRIDEATLVTDNLMAKEQYMHTTQYIQDVAKDKLGLVYPDEIVIKPEE